MFRRDFFKKGVLAGLFGGLFASTKLEGNTIAVAQPTDNTTYLQASAGELKWIKPEPKFRVWKIGSHEHKIYPTKAAVEKLQGLINEAKKTEGTFDLIWGPDLEVVEVGGGDTKDVILMEDVCLDYLKSTGKYWIGEKYGLRTWEPKA
jgi:hypothetical protein